MKHIILFTIVLLDKYSKLMMKMEIGSSGASALRSRILSTIKIKVPLTKPTG